MILAKSKEINEQSGVIEEMSYSIKMENLPILFDIVRNQLYSDGLAAIIREYSQNSRGSHIAAGKPNLPIEITLPSQLNSFFSARDFGVGMSKQDVEEYFAGFGSSSKRNTNTQTGAFGIGASCFACVCDSIILECYNDGILETYSCYIDPSKLGKVALLSSSETKEANGVKVTIPIKPSDVTKVIDKAFHIFQFWDIKPVIHGINDAQKAQFKTLCDKKPLFSGKGWKLMGDGDKSWAIMGGEVSYPIQSDVFGDELSANLRNLLAKGIRLDCKIGALEPSASRESLKYTEKTKKHLIHLLNEAHQEILATVNSKFSGSATLWDAKLLYKSIFDSNGEYYSIRNLFDRSIKFQGADLNGDDFLCNQYCPVSKTRLVDCTLYSKENSRYGYGNSGKVKRSKINSIRVSDKTLVVFNDKNIINGIINRVVGQIENKTYDQVYVLNFHGCSGLTEALSRAEWINQSKFDGPNVVMLSSLPKEALSIYYPDCGNSTRTLAFPTSTLEFEYNRNPKASGSYGTKNSDWWVAATVDVTKDSGVYVQIERFEYRNKSTWYENPNKLVSAIASLEAAGITVPKIYGLKPKSVEKIKGNKNMVNFWVWAKEATAAKLKSVEKDYADYTYTRGSLVNSIGNLSNFINVKWSANANSPLVKLTKDIKASYGFRNDSKMDGLKSLMVSYNIAPTMVSSHNLEKDINAAKERYPLIFTLWKNSYYDITDSKPLIKHIGEYVDLIDMAKP